MAYDDYVANPLTPGAGSEFDEGPLNQSFQDYIYGADAYLAGTPDWASILQDLESVLDLGQTRADAAMEGASFVGQSRDLDREIAKQEQDDAAAEGYAWQQGAQAVKSQLLGAAGTKPLDKVLNILDSEMYQAKFGDPANKLKHALNLGDLKAPEGTIINIEKATKHLGDLGYNVQDGVIQPSINPQFQEQGLFERALKPGQRETLYTPSKTGVYGKGATIDPDTAKVMRGGEEAASFGSETGYGARGGPEGKLSKLKFNQETGLYEKRLDLGKVATMGASIWDSYNAIKQNQLFQKGSKGQSTTNYLRALAPALAMTPYGWAGAAALQGGMRAWDTLAGNKSSPFYSGELNKLDKALKKLSWKNIFG
mgnify:CR=1 FL=1